MNAYLWGYERKHICVWSWGLGVWVQRHPTEMQWDCTEYPRNRKQQWPATAGWTESWYSDLWENEQNSLSLKVWGEELNVNFKFNLCTLPLKKFAVSTAQLLSTSTNNTFLKKQNNVFLSKSAYYNDFWRIMWHWRLEEWCWKFNFESQE